jgi:hypothetical protein
MLLDYPGEEAGGLSDLKTNFPFSNLMNLKRHYTNDDFSTAEQ